MRTSCEGAADVKYNMHALQEVLRQEQRVLTEMDDTVMQRVLGACQCARLIVEAFPAAPGALPLAEAVAMMDEGVH